jgi:hypothetical protein
MEAKARLITEQQKVGLIKQALDQELAADEAALQKELQLANLRPEEEKKINDEIEALRREHNEKLQEIDQQGADAAAKSWQDAGRMIEGAINSQLKSVLSGGESVRTAMAKIAQDLIMDFAKIGEDKLVTGITNQLASSFGDIGGALTSLAANMLKAISAGAGETAAGVSGFLAPIIGPAAVPAGLAAGAAISAGARGIGSADIGMYNVPHDQLALIHRNELVMPAPQAAQFRANLEAGGAGGRGGDGDTHNNTFHIHPHPNQDPQDIARAVVKVMNTNPSLRPRY